MSTKQGPTTVLCIIPRNKMSPNFQKLELELWNKNWGTTVLRTKKKNLVFLFFPGIKLHFKAQIFTDVGIRSEVDPNLTTIKLKKLEKIVF